MVKIFGQVRVGLQGRGGERIFYCFIFKNHCFGNIMINFWIQLNVFSPRHFDQFGFLEGDRLPYPYPMTIPLLTHY